MISSKQLSPSSPTLFEEGGLAIFGDLGFCTLRDFEVLKLGFG